MKATSLKEIKAELDTLHPVQIQELCIRMAKFKKENKELLTYLLFDAQDERAYIGEVKAQIDELFKEVRKGQSYLAKKTIRKILAGTNKYIRYSGIKTTEIELRIHFCKKLRKAGIPLYVNTTLGNLYLRQLDKIKKILSTLHEDLQLDYAGDLEILQSR